MRYALTLIIIMIASIVYAASGDKPNRVVVNKFITTTPPAICTKGEMQMKAKRLYLCYATNKWSFANLSTAWP
jgi:hypothetical protein